MEFFQTPMGRKYYQVDLPKIIDVLERIAVSLEQLSHVQTWEAMNTHMELSESGDEVQHKP